MHAFRILAPRAFLISQVKTALVFSGEVCQVNRHSSCTPHALLKVHAVPSFAVYAVLSYQLISTCAWEGAPLPMCGVNRQCNHFPALPCSWASARAGRRTQKRWRKPHRRACMYFKPTRVGCGIDLFPLSCATHSQLLENTITATIMRKQGQVHVDAAPHGSCREAEPCKAHLQRVLCSAHTPFSG